MDLCVHVPSALASHHAYLTVAAKVIWPAEPGTAAIVAEAPSKLPDVENAVELDPPRVSRVR